MSKYFDAKFPTEEARKAYYAEKTREWNAVPENVAKRKAYMAEYTKRRANDPTFREQRRLASLRYHHRHREEVLARVKARSLADPGPSTRSLRYRYGITREQFDVMLLTQCGRCGICGKNFGEKNIHIDHDHETGTVRGLLCSVCNRALGVFGDNAGGIRNVLDYLAA